MTTSNLTLKCIRWIQNWFKNNGPGCNAVIGISGGKDSTVAAMLCVEALGKDRVIGVLMPNGEQKDIEDSYKVVKTLGIRYFVHNIKEPVSAILDEMESNDMVIRQQTVINLPPRIRMSTLYAYSQSLNGRVVNTCNFNETMCGFETKNGDSVGDFSPLGKLFVSDVCEIGKYIAEAHYPELIDLVFKTPMDGLNTNEDGSYVTDEDILGVSYATIEAHLTGVTHNARVEHLIRTSEFKRKPMSTFNPYETL